MNEKIEKKDFMGFSVRGGGRISAQLPISAQSKNIFEIEILPEMSLLPTKFPNFLVFNLLFSIFIFSQFPIMLGLSLGH